MSILSTLMTTLSLSGSSPTSSAPEVPPSPVSPSPQLRCEDRRDRPEYFVDIGHFLETNNANNLHLRWTPGYRARVTPRTIIYIKDDPPDTRISDRVMLVLCKNKDTESSVTCLPFCRHFDVKPETLHKTHRIVKEADPQSMGEATSPTSRGPVVTNTRPSASKSRFVEVDLSNCHVGSGPQPGLTLNCEEIWNVELNVNVAILGEVPASSFKEVVEDAKALFCTSLDQAAKDDEDPSAAYHSPTRTSTTPIIETNRIRCESQQSKESGEKTRDRPSDKHKSYRLEKRYRK